MLVKIKDSNPTYVLYDVDYPEGTFANWLRALAGGDWQWATNLTQRYWVFRKKNPAHRLEGALSSFRQLLPSKHFVVLWAKTIGTFGRNKNVMIEVEAFLEFPSGKRRTFTAILIRERVPKVRRKWLFWKTIVPQPSIDGQWGVNPISAMRQLPV